MTRYFSCVSRDVEMLAEVVEKSENQISWQKEIVAALRQLADVLDRQQRTYVRPKMPRQIGRFPVNSRERKLGDLLRAIAALPVNALGAILRWLLPTWGGGGN